MQPKLDLLSKYLGPQRAVSSYAFVQTRGMAVLGGLVLVVIVGLLWLTASDDEHRHDAYLVLPVLSATPLGPTLDNGVVASVRLPDGKAASLTSKDPEIARSVRATACVEQRVYVESGEPFYKLSLPVRCSG